MTQQALEPGVIPRPEGVDDDSQFEFVSAGDNPLLAMAAISEQAKQHSNSDDTPLIGEPGDTTGRLPGGYVDAKGIRHLSAEVRELTGEDEEALARAAAGNSIARYQQVLLERGVVNIGPYPATPTLLGELLAGDRDALMLAIRVATYGDLIDADVRCPQPRCGVEAHIQVEANVDIKVKTLEDKGPDYHIDLRNGHTAKIRLVIGSDLNALGEQEDATAPEADTLLLSRAILAIDGVPLKPGTALETVKKLGMADRRTIRLFLTETQPGPQFEDVKYACTACGKEMSLGLAMSDLFPR